MFSSKASHWRVEVGDQVKICRFSAAASDKTNVGG